MAAGDRAICQEGNILKTDTNSDTHICRGDKDQSRSLSVDIFFPKDAVSPGSRELASSRRGDGRGFEVGLRSAVCRLHTSMLKTPEVVITDNRAC